MSDTVADPADSNGSPSDLTEQTAKERFSAFYTVYMGLFGLLFTYLISVWVIERNLDIEFQHRVDRAIEVTNFDRPVVEQMTERIQAAVNQSRWVRWGGLRVTTLVLALDGETWLYVDGYAIPAAPEGIAPTDVLREWMDLLPASAQVQASLPHNALASNMILISYATVLLVFLYRANRKVTGREAERLQEALVARNQTAERAAEIEAELDKTRSRLTEIEPMEREQSDEIDSLQSERAALRQKLAELAAREESLRGRADRAVDLAQDVRALEDLLEEATGDLDSKNDEISRLEQSLKKASKGAARADSAKSKANELLGRRLKTLYKTLEVDDRAVEDIASLGDESLRLKAEESIKRLAEDAENVAVRRKVGGLPEHVQVYELGFAGKGRIYYTRGKSRRFRILKVGAKNTQDADLDYMSRLPREEFN